MKRVQPKTMSFLMACCLAAGLQSAAAGPVTIGGLTSGFRGDTVSLTLFDDSVTDLEAADIRLTFDPRFLSFSDATGGTLTSNFSIVAGSELPVGVNGDLVELLISLATGLDLPLSGRGSVLVASLVIKPAAPLGTTRVGFETLDASLYDFPAASAHITVGTPIPIGNTGVLALTGLLAMIGFGRRQRDGRVEPPGSLSG